MPPSKAEIEVRVDAARASGKVEGRIDSILEAIQQQGKNIQQLFDLQRTCKKETCAEIDRVERESDAKIITVDRRVDRLSWRLALYGTVIGTALAIFGPPIGEHLVGGWLNPPKRETYSEPPAKAAGATLPLPAVAAEPIAGAPQ